MEKAPFMAMVFTNLLFQSSVAYMSALRNQDHFEKNKVLYFVTFLATLVPLLLGRPKSLLARFVLFTLFSIAVGAMSAKGIDVIKEVLVVFSAMLLLGFVSVQLGIDLRPYGFHLAMLLLATILFRIASGQKIMSTLFAAFIVFYTNEILQKDYSGDFIQASLDYFTGIVNLLLNQVEE